MAPSRLGLQAISLLSRNLTRSARSAAPVRPLRGARSFGSSSFRSASARPKPNAGASQASSDAGPSTNTLQALLRVPGFSSFWLVLLSITGAAGAGYMVNSLVNAGAPPPSFTVIDSKRAKELQLANQPSYGSKADYDAAIKDLQELWRMKGKPDKISTDEADLETHGISEWSYHEAERPTVVVWVESTEEVRQVVRIATKWRVPITPFSGGTSLEGHFSSVSLPCNLVCSRGRSGRWCACRCFADSASHTAASHSTRP